MRPDRRVQAAFIGAVLFGGVNAIAIRQAVLELPPLWAMAARFVAAGSALSGLTVARGRSFRRGRRARVAGRAKRAGRHGRGPDPAAAPPPVRARDPPAPGALHDPRPRRR